MGEPPIRNIAAHLPRMAQRQPHRLAVVFPQGRDAGGRVSYTHFTFQQLDQESNRLAHALESIGIGRGTRTVLMVKPSLEFFALTFALFKMGAVPVLVDPGMGVKNLGQCLAEAEPEAFIGIPKAHMARCLLGWAKKSLRIHVTVGRSLGWGGVTLRELLRQFRDDPQIPPHPQPLSPEYRGEGSKLASLSPHKGEQRNTAPLSPEYRGEGSGVRGDIRSQPASVTDYHMASTQAEDTAAILFTSGSTGIPKGAVYTHGIFLAQVDILRQTYGIEPGEIDLATFPLFALFAPALGMTAIIPDMDATRPARVDPRKIIEAIDNFGVTNLFGSPALLNRVGLYGEQHGIRLPSVRRVLSAGAPVPAAVVERFVNMLPTGAEVFTPYGATEALPVSSIGSSEILGETRKGTEQGRGVCVGRPVPGAEVAIIRISDEPLETWSDALRLPPGEIGEIVVRGPVVTHRYFHREASTRLAKISAADGTFYHRMGDVGYLDERGRLWMCGRKSHRVVTKQGTLFTIPCEGIFNTHPKVYRTALVGVPRGAAVQPVLCVELRPEQRSANREQIRQELLHIGAGHEQSRPIQHMLFHPAFPVDIRHNAKIFREKLAVWAARQLP